MHRAAGPACLYCWHPVDNAEHTVFNFSHWNSHHRRLEEIFGRRTHPNDVQELLCGPKEVAALPLIDHSPPWVERRRNAFVDMVEAILGDKEDDERRRQQYWVMAGVPENTSPAMHSVNTLSISRCLPLYYYIASPSGISYSLFFIFYYIPCV